MKTFPTQMCPQMWRTVRNRFISGELIVRGRGRAVVINEAMNSQLRQGTRDALKCHQPRSIVMEMSTAPRNLATNLDTLSTFLRHATLVDQTLYFARFRAVKYIYKI